MNQQKPSSKRAKKDLAGHLAAGLKNRPGGRLRSMREVGPAPDPVAVPMADDGYEISVENIKPDPKQPRKLFDQAELDQLAQSIRENGILQPIEVHQGEDPTTYYIIHGERRWRAAKLAGLSTVPAIVKTITYDQDRLEQQQLVENVQRADLEPIEAARALKRWMDEHHLSQRDAGKRLGKPKTWIAELLSRVKNANEQEQLFKRMLAGNSPWSEAKKTRQEKERTITYRKRFAFEGSPFAVTVTADMHPEDVALQQVVDALQRLTAQLQEELLDHEKSGRTSTNKKRGA